MFALARTFALIGVAAEPVHVEVDIGSGLPSFTIGGLPDAAVPDGWGRGRAVLSNSGVRYPQHRFTGNLAPAAIHNAWPVCCLGSSPLPSVVSRGLSGPVP